MRTSIRPTVAVVHLGAARRNLTRMRATVGAKVGIYGVVKADAYGHGAVEMARALANGCQALAVSLVEEAFELRQAGLQGNILVLGSYYNRHHDEVIEADLVPVIHDPADLDRFAAAAGKRGRRVSVHLKVDTGMSRLGVSLDELPAVLERAAGLGAIELGGFCTHLASADLPDEAPTREQLRKFAGAVDELKRRVVDPARVVLHAANSAATVRFADARLGAVRPGLALYGAMPSATVAVPTLEPTLSLRTRAMTLRRVPAGTHVSYGGVWTAPRPSVIATLPLGYADGYPRHVRGAEVLVRGRRAPVVGNVCMDMLMVDVTDVPGVDTGDAVTLIGRDGDQRITIDDLAGWAGTINYEILCGISKRVPRHYEDA